jgi:hypothetical protein
MRTVTLVCSLHRENGACNAAELLKLLRVLDPDVIFGEVLQSDPNFYHPRSLESQAVTRFLALKSCHCVCVDRYEVPPDFREITDSVFDFVCEMNPEYLALEEHRDHATYLNGFAYLNSAAFAQLIIQMSAIEEHTVRLSGKQDLIRGLTSWRNFTQDRERAMVYCIHSYCRDNAFDRGVFLVGAAHRSGVAKAIEEAPDADALVIDWKLHL